MLNLKFPFISSLLVSFCIYVSILFLIFIKLSIFSEPAKRYTDNKDVFIDVAFIERDISDETKSLQNDKTIKKDNSKIQVKDEEKEEKLQTTTKEASLRELAEIEQKNIPSEKTKQIEIKTDANVKQIDIEEKKPNLKSLFDDIDIKNLKDVSKEKKVQSRQKDDKKTVQNSTQASDIVKSLKIDTKSTTKKSQSAEIYDPFKGAITNQIKRRWREYKANSDNKAMVKILIDGSGNFNYEILELSYDNEFNKKVNECLGRLSLEKFPFSPDGKSVSLNLELIDKIDN